MAEQLAEIDAIAANPAAADLREHDRRARAGRPDLRPRHGRLRRLQLDHEHAGVPGRSSARWRRSSPPSATDHPERQALRAHRRGLRGARDVRRSPPEQQRLVWLIHNNFVRAGARLDGAAKERLSAINQRLATLYTQFSQNVLADETDYVLFLEQRGGSRRAARLDSSPARRPRRRRAASRGKWAILNTRSSMEPFLTYSDRRDLRERVWRTYYSRGDNGDAKDNNAIITEILKLRAERAKLLGYADARPLAARERDGQDPRARHGAAGGGVEAGGGAGARRGRRHAGDRRRGGRKLDHRAVGLPLLRREGAQGEVRPRRERGQAVPAAREAARGDVLGGGRALRLPLRAGWRRAGGPPRRARLGGDRRGERPARRALVLRPLRPAGQALRRLDERLPHARSGSTARSPPSSRTTRTS